MKFLKKYTSFGTNNSVFKKRTDLESLVSNFRFAIRTVDKYVPWENRCRHQAYQAKLLCNLYKIPYEVYVGFKKNEKGEIIGHAWTIVNKQMITGFCKPEDYIVQAVYS